MQETMNAIDLFSGCGGLSEGLKQAGFNIVAGIEIDPVAATTYRMNHPNTALFEENIRDFDTSQIVNLLNGEPLGLLAGCPPCQGFSSLRKLNRKASVQDQRNSLINEYYRFVDELNPLTFMLENVPGIVNYSLFKTMLRKLTRKGYNWAFEVVDVADYSVPQRRKRLVLVGSRLGNIGIAKGAKNRVTVREAFKTTKRNGRQDMLRNIYPHHSEHIRKLIGLIPKDGGSRKDLPSEYILDCHKKNNIGFNDIYGRLSWDKVSSTITGGCLNPSKGRFLHPEEDRCISAREAALLQSFPVEYKFPTNVSMASLALLIGNALPPRFSFCQSENIMRHILKHFG